MPASRQRALHGRHDSQLPAKVSPTHVTNVLFGYAAIVEALTRRQGDGGEPFLPARRFCNCMSASLSLHIVEANSRALPLTNSDREIPILSGWGGTELGPTCTRAHWLLDLPGSGWRALSLERKFGWFLPEDRLELRVKGPNATAGYREMADKTAEAFDELGYYRTGDAGELVDPASPEKVAAVPGTHQRELQAGNRFLGECRRPPAGCDLCRQAAQSRTSSWRAIDRSEICLVVIPEEDGMREIAGSSSPDSARDQVCDFLRSRLGEFNASESKLQPMDLHDGSA